MPEIFSPTHIESVADLERLNELSQPNRVLTICNILDGRELRASSKFIELTEDDIILQNFKVLTPDTQRDLALCLRSRTVSHELELLGKLPVNGSEFIFDAYNTYLVPPLGHSGYQSHHSVITRAGYTYLISAENWGNAWEQLNGGDFGRAVVLLPELITVAGIPIEAIHHSRSRVEEAIWAVRELSMKQDEATFVITTPHFETSSERPFNGAYVIRDGEVVDIATKQVLSYAEGKYISVRNLKDHRPAATIDDNAVLICSDLIGIGTLSWYIPDKVKTLLVSACWGIPGSPDFSSNVPRDSDQATAYYLSIQKRVSNTALRRNPNIERIVVCDRALSEGVTRNGFYANRPLSSVRYQEMRKRVLF